ncbi:hypothetical protein SAMN05443144_13715 [Fodinibius roseus]|uniref:Uncharacterized protein n=1 Tax=Fodinibius roseus TaxID=1194090 RepID=A0A1M5L3T9_9BACT|nr:hypothetical protein [Fodinibius roseus]SHG59671.1 hypothetical protein SAMN05443144_13715 [Fodinibius roseus]
MITCRGIEVNWDEFAEITDDREADPETVVKYFIDAFEGLLMVNQTLLEESVEYKSEEYHPFIKVFEEVSVNAIDALRDNRPDTELRNISESLRLSRMPQELMAYAGIADASNEDISIDSKLNNAETVQDSVKELLKKAWNPWWLDPVLKALDEVIDIFRGS